MGIIRKYCLLILGEFAGEALGGRVPVPVVFSNRLKSRQIGQERRFREHGSHNTEVIQMTTAKALEYRIIRRLTSPLPPPQCEPDRDVRWADRVIAVTALTAGLFVLGTYLEELLWAVIAALTIFALGARE